jgi:TolB protein
MKIWLALLFLSLSLMRADDQPTVQADGDIFFVSENASGGRDIFRKSAGSSKAEKITKHSGRGHSPHYNHPKLSPDGTTLVYQNDTDGHDRYAIWTMKTDGSDQKRLTGKEGMFPNWSPDGKRIVFSGRRNGAWEILEIPATGGPEKNLTEKIKGLNKNAWAATSSYSADGSTLIFSYIREKALYSMDLSTSEVKKINPSGYFITHAVFSPDGLKIAANAKTGNAYDLITMSADGEDVQVIVSNVVSYSAPSWSADAKAILFTGMVNGHQEVFKVDIESGEETQITHHQNFAAMPTWR